MKNLKTKAYSIGKKDGMWVVINNNKVISREYDNPITAMNSLIHHMEDQIEGLFGRNIIQDEKDILSENDESVYL